MRLGRGVAAPEGNGGAGFSLLLLPALLLAFGVPNSGAAFGAPASLHVEVHTTPASNLPSPAQLSTAAAPSLICVGGSTDCPAGVGQARVELSADIGGQPTQYWPNVQIAFVIDTSVFAGDYGTDTPGLDPCAAGGNPVCEESNGIPFLIANAGQVVNEIQAANPHSNVSYALVDYYDAWGSGWDDADGPEYHVDIGQFIPGTQFPGAMKSTFVQSVLGGLWYSWDQDMDNDFLDTSSITALYGALVGSDLDWSPGAHHVIVWMGITAPRAEGYQQNYCVSDSAWNQWGAPSSCYSMDCEPSYPFPTGASPNCEGWTVSQDSNSSHDIAALAHTAKSCVDSAGGSCVIDTIDLWGTPTDPYSKGWRSGVTGGGPGGSLVWQNVNRVLSAGCAMAAATGGTWDGPSWYTCPDGQAGTLQYVVHGSIAKPNTNNPTLLEAFKRIGFGPVTAPETLNSTGRPFFTFVPANGVTISPTPAWATSCSTPTGPEVNCPVEPTVATVDGVSTYGWNWSNVPSQNVLGEGDLWTAQFNVEVTGPAAYQLPVDACATTSCRFAGGGPIDGLYTAFSFFIPAHPGSSSGTSFDQSFPLAQVELQETAGIAPLPSAPPAPPVAPPGIPAPVPQAVPVSQQVLVGVQLPTTVAQFQALAAGVLAMGATRVGMRNRPIANPVLAAKQAQVRSKFDGAPVSDSGGVGRWT